MLKKFVAAAMLTMLVFSLPARVIDVRKKAEINPTITFSGAGDAVFSTEIGNILGVCGWFDVVPAGGKADFELKISGATMALYQQSHLVKSWNLPASSDKRALAKTAVDTIIEFVFQQLKVRGFCHSRIAFCAETSPGVRNVFICDIDGRNVTPLTNYRTLNVEPCWSPDGKTLCFSKYGRSGIDIIETTLRTPRRSRIISSFRGINAGAAISPDGKYLAAILSPDHHVDLYILGLHRREKRRLTRGIAVEASPCWSPDGSRLAFVSDSRGNPRVFVISATGGNATLIPVVSGGVDAVTPSWSGDDQIAYATRLRGGSNYVVAVYDMRSGENRVVSKGAGSWESPCWAADNRHVVCKRTVNGKSELWVLDTRTGRERMLLRTGSRLFDPAWSPCQLR